MTFSDSVAPICLPSATTNYDNKLATVAGWGLLGTNLGDNPLALFPAILQKVRIDILTSTKILVHFVLLLDRLM